MASPSSEPARIDPPLGDQLLESAAWVLSQGDAISASTRDVAEQALWDLSGWSMDRSLGHADRVMPAAARFRASAALARADPDAYDATRRRQQTFIALGIALLVGLLALWPSPWRRPAALLALSAVGWALFTLQTSGVRDLPPPPLQLLSVAALAFFSAGAAAAVAAIFPRRTPGVASTAIRILATVIAAAMVGGLVCFVTRSARLFPSGMEGWELIVDPLAAAILAFVIAVILMAVDTVIPRPRLDAAGGGKAPA